MCLLDPFAPLTRGFFIRVLYLIYMTLQMLAEVLHACGTDKHFISRLPINPSQLLDLYQSELITGLEYENYSQCLNIDYDW
jgi:hypothetical protein